MTVALLFVRPETLVSRRACILLAFIFFLFLRHDISEVRWPIAAKLSHVMESVFCFIMLVQHFERALLLPPFKKLEGPRTGKIWRDFRQL